MEIRQLLTGCIAMGFTISAMFFFRFRRSTGDRLFSMFGVAFLMLGIQQVLLAVEPSASESYPMLFLIRLAAFILILIAILDKNLRAKRQ